MGKRATREDDVPIISTCRLISKRKVNVRRRVTRHATIMTKRGARRRWILHRISSIRAFGRYVIRLRRLWRNQQCGKRADIATIEQTTGVSASVRPTISVKYVTATEDVDVGVTSVFPYNTKALPLPPAALMGEKEGKKRISVATLAGLLLSSISRRRGETSDDCAIFLLSSRPN